MELQGILTKYLKSKEPNFPNEIMKCDVNNGADRPFIRLCASASDFSILGPILGDQE